MSVLSAIKSRITLFLSPTCFFHKFFGDSKPTEVSCEVYDLIHYYFFTHGLTYKDIIDVEIFLRQTIKADYTFSESLLPVDFMNYFTRAMQIEDAKKEAVEDAKRENMKNVR